MLKLGLGLAAVVVAADQASKWYLHELLVTGGPRRIQLLPFFDLVAVWNYGISFGVFNTGSAGPALIFVALALVIVTGLVVWLRQVDSWWVAAGLGLVIGGAIGNVIDRLRLGAVFDFLLFYAYGYHFPAFNLADSAITAGVAVLFIDALPRRHGSTK
jgi:signal peptidase II